MVSLMGQIFVVAKLSSPRFPSFADEGCPTRQQNHADIWRMPHRTFLAELEKKKKKEQREREEKVRRNNKIQHLFDPTNYTMELNRFRDDDVFAETYGKWHRGHWYHFGKYFQKSGIFLL